MGNRHVVRSVVGLAMTLVLPFASADVVYRAERSDAQGSKRNFDITILASEQGTRVDVSRDGQARVSMIELSDRIVLIDIVSKVYVVQETSNLDTGGAFAPSWLPTIRRQFAIGSYCNLFEVRLSEAVYDERCASAGEKAKRVRGVTRVGEFLGEIAAASDAQALFELAVRTLASAAPAADFPLAVGRFESGKVLGEFRILSVTDEPLSRSAFDIPRGMRRIAASGDTAKQAAR